MYRLAEYSHSIGVQSYNIGNYILINKGKFSRINLLECFKVLTKKGINQSQYLYIIFCYRFTFTLAWYGMSAIIMVRSIRIYC